MLRKYQSFFCGKHKKSTICTLFVLTILICVFTIINFGLAANLINYDIQTIKEIKSITKHDYTNVFSQNDANIPFCSNTTDLLGKPIKCTLYINQTVCSNEKIEIKKTQVNYNFDDFVIQYCKMLYNEEYINIDCQKKFSIIKSGNNIYLQYDYNSYTSTIPNKQIVSFDKTVWNVKCIQSYYQPVITQYASKTSIAVTLNNNHTYIFDYTGNYECKNVISSLQFIKVVLIYIHSDNNYISIIPNWNQYNYNISRTGVLFGNVLCMFISGLAIMYFIFYFGENCKKTKSTKIAANESV